MRKPLAFAAAAAGVALATVGVVASPAGAQGYFGQNQVQYDHFDWRVLESEHFLVHYYPAEREAAVDATRMAERSYARLSRVLDHQFREKKPIILFASRADFGQNNVTGDLGEGTGGVTEPLRQRNLFYMPGDYRGTEHVLTHEMVHQFQYDIFSRGKAGANLQALQQNDPPLWFAEGMAEYLSIGPHHPFTDTWVRDAALNGNLPTIEQMTLRPDRYFPYRYGEALWSYIGARWGDEVIGQIMNAVPSIGVERAFKRELGMSLEDLSDEWREAMQTKFLPGVATTERPRKFAQALLSERRSGGQVFVAPVLSSDGKYVAFLSNGSFLRGEVFIDLWLGDARTGKRIKRLVKSTLNTDAEELGIIYSQSAFSPDAKTLAYSALRKGKEVLYLLNVRKRDVIRRFDLPGVENVSGPSFSPDGKQIVFSGGVGGITDLYVVNVDGSGLRRLTNDRNADVQPQWSPDGRTIAFASDRGPQTDFGVLRFSPWEIALIDVASGRVEVPAGQAGLNLNPMWAPDGRSIAYVSDRTGTQNIFLYDLDRRDHFQLTNVVGGVLSFTEQSPVISWAHQADRLAFTYYENGDMTVWTIDNPRLLRRDPYRAPTSTDGAKVIAAAAQAAARDSARLRDSSVAVALAADTTGLALRQRSFYRSPNETVRASAELPAADIRAADTAVVSVARLLDSAALALPDTSKFKDYAYHVGYQPEYVARPSVGYVGGTNFGRGVFGGTTIVLSDLLGNNRLAFSGQVNGRVSEAQLFAGYTNLSHRLQYTTGVVQQPYYVLAGQGYSAGRATGLLTEETDIVRYLVRDVFLVGMYPFSRFTRFELGTEFSNVDRAVQRIGRDVLENTGQPYSDYYYIEQKNLSSFNYAAPFAGYVSDNALFGYTGPIMGRRYHFQVQPTIGSFRWIDYLADYRRYDPILFNFLTVATRVGADISVGRDEMALPKYLGSPQSNFWLRGYDRQNFFSTIGCNQGTFGVNSACGAPQMIGSRVVLASAELRFPLVRRFDLGLLPVSLPPLDGLVFYDAGMAWQGGQTAHFLRPPNDYDPALDRYLLTSYGAGLRLNLFNFALLRWDYAIPIDQPNHKGFWQFSLGPSF